MRYTLDNFYQSKEWLKFRQVVISERVNDDGFIYDEVTGKPIINAYDIILHHKVFLTDANVNDANISLNPDLIQIVSHRTHNLIHNKLGYHKQEVFLVYGSPLSGKTTYVNTVLLPGDLVVDIDRIWEAISMLGTCQKPARLNAVVFGVRDYLMDCIRIHRGKWQNAYIIGGYPLSAERERICRLYGAREIYIESTKDICLQRLEQVEDRDKAEWKKYIESWWERYSPLTL